MNKTRKAAEYMLGKGWFTAGTLGAQLGVSAQEAAGYLFNIRHSNVYQTEVTPVPGRKVKLIAIDGRQTPQGLLWRTAIFGSVAA